MQALTAAVTASASAAGKQHDKGSWRSYYSTTKQCAKDHSRSCPSCIAVDMVLSSSSAAEELIPLLMPEPNMQPRWTIRSSANHSCTGFVHAVNAEDLLQTAHVRNCHQR